MSLHQNDVWLEEMNQKFQEALQTRNQAEALLIVTDIRQKGFESEAASLFIDYDAEFPPEN